MGSQTWCKPRVADRTTLGWVLGSIVMDLASRHQKRLKLTQSKQEKVLPILTCVKQNLEKVVQLNYEPEFASEAKDHQGYCNLNYKNNKDYEKTNNLISPILLTSIAARRSLWSANEGGFFDPFNFVIFWGGTSLALVLSVLLNGWDGVKKDFKDRY